MSMEIGNTTGAAEFINIGRGRIRKEEGGKRFMGMGASSILMLFVVLCLTTFAILSLVSAQADLHMSEKARDAVQAYYQADAKMEKAISDMDAALAAQQAALSHTVWPDLSKIKIDGMTVTGENSVTIKINITDGRYIEAMITINKIGEAVRYKVESRRMMAVTPDYNDNFEFIIIE